MSEERVLGKIDEVQESIARIDERQKNVMKELGEIKRVVTGNGLLKKVTILESHQEINEKWFSRIWVLLTGIGASIILMAIGYLLDKFAF